MAAKSKKKRIGYILRRFPVLSETFILNEILELEELGAKVEIYSLLQSRDPRFHKGVVQLAASIRYVPNIFDLSSLFRYNRKAIKTFGKRYWQILFRCVFSFHPILIWRFLQAGYIAQRAHERRIEHLHAHFANRATNVARLVHQLTDIPYSFTAHAVDIYKNLVNKTVLAKKLTSAEFAVAISESNRRFLQNVSNGAKVDIERIYNGIDLGRFQTAMDDQDNQTVSLLTVARFVEKKGLDILIKACGELHRQGIDFQCNIIGKGRQHANLKALIEANDLTEKVHLLGVHTQDEIINRYRASDIFVLPCIVASDGNRDGLPVSIVEALASGLPVISTDVTGIPEVLRHEENGLLVKQGDVQDLADAMKRLIINSDLRRQLGEAARPSVVNQFDIKKSVALLNDRFQGPRA